MLNIASVNMPKIKPETKVLIIKNLQSKSPAEVADIFNVSKWQVERIRQRYQETGDVHDRPRSGRPRKTTARDDSLLVRLTAPGGVEASDACFVKNCTSDSCTQWSPWSYCCPETSAKQETAKKPCCVRQGQQPDGRLYSRKFHFSDESLVELHLKRRQYCRRPSGARQDPRFIQKTVKFGGGKIMVWGYIQYGGTREICKVDGNIDSAKYQQIQSQLQEGSDFSTGWSSLPFLRFHYEVSWGEEDQGPSVSSLQIWILLSISGEEWRRKLGGPSRRTWRSFGMPTRWPSMPSSMTSSTSSTTLCQTGWQLFCRPKEPIQDMNYLTFSPWWKTWLIFHLLFYWLFEKDKMYWL